MKELVFKPIAGRTEEIIDAILQTGEVASCTKELYAIHLVCEELVVNVVSYAYPEGVEGYLKIQIEKADGSVQSVGKGYAGCFSSAGRTPDRGTWNLPYGSDDG